MALVAFVTKAGRPVVFRTAKRSNPSARQRRRSEIKHRAAQKGLVDKQRGRGELADMVRARRARLYGRKEQRTLKERRRMGSRMLASSLVGHL